MPEGPSWGSNTCDRGPRTYLISTYNCPLPPHNSSFIAKQAEKFLHPSGLQQLFLTLLQASQVKGARCTTINPATLPCLPENTGEEHSCTEFLSTFISTFPHISELPLSSPEDTWFIHGSSFMNVSQHRAGYALVPSTQVVETSLDPPGMSSQAELIALI